MAGKRVERISFGDEHILHAVRDFHYLTAEQLCRLLYQPTSLNYAREQLKRLFDANYLNRTFGPRSQAAGSSPWVYLLGRRGIRYFREHKLEINRRYRPSEEKAHSDQFLFHTLAVNDVLITAVLLVRRRTDITLEQLRHDLDLKRTPVRVSAVGKGRNVELQSVVPDGWLRFRVPGPTRSATVALLLELDRGTISVKALKRKVRGLLAFLAGPYEQTFGTRSGSVAFVVDEGAFARFEGARRRLKDLCRWTEEELKLAGKHTFGERFVFTLLPQERAVDPNVFFLSPRCRVPFSALPCSLFGLPDPVVASRIDG